MSWRHDFQPDLIFRDTCRVCGGGQHDHERAARAQHVAKYQQKRREAQFRALGRAGRAPAHARGEGIFG